MQEAFGTQGTPSHPGLRAGCGVCR